MRRIYENLKRIKEKIDNEKGCMCPYQEILNKFVNLITYEDTYLGTRRIENVTLKTSGEDMFLDCGGFGIIVTPKGEISIHT